MIELTDIEYCQVNVALIAASMFVDPEPHGISRDPVDLQRALTRAINLLEAAYSRRVRQ
jgi:hypothetical protein